MPYPYRDEMQAVVTGIESVPTVLGHAFEALRGASEGLGDRPAARRPPEAEGGRREATVPSGGCPCVTCPESRDCEDDFYCVRFERWFAAQSEERW